MQLGKRRQTHHWTTTPIGRLQPSQGLQPKHAEAALRLDDRGRKGIAIDTTRPRTSVTSPAQVRGAVKLLIGCARRAGMGSIRAVAQAVRLVLRRVPEPGDDTINELAPAAVEAAAESSEILSLHPREAAAAAGLAALETTRELDGTTPDGLPGEIVSAVREQPRTRAAADERIRV